MNNKNITPKYKQLNNTITAEQFVAMNNDMCIMDTAKQALAKDLTNEHFKNEWEKHRSMPQNTRQDQTHGTNDSQVCTPTSRR